MYAGTNIVGRWLLARGVRRRCHSSHHWVVGGVAQHPEDGEQACGD